MPFDPDSPFALADPSQWWQTGVLPRIIVHPKPSPNVAASDGIDDWFVPGPAQNRTDLPNDRIASWSAETDASYPDDWIYPDNPNAPTPPAAPSTAPPAPSLQPANPATSNRPAVPPDPFAAYWSLIPASRVGALAWAPPFFPSSNPFSPQNIPTSAGVTSLPNFPNSFGQFPSAANAQPDLPLDIGANGLLGGIGRMLAERAKADDSWAAAANGILGGIAKMLAASASPSPLSAAGSRGLLGGLANLQPAPSNAQAHASYAFDARPFIPPDPIAFQDDSPLSGVELVADKKKVSRDLELFDARAFGITPPVGSTAPRPVPPFVAWPRPSPPSLQAPPPQPPSSPSGLPSSSSGQAPNSPRPSGMPIGPASAIEPEGVAGNRGGADAVPRGVFSPTPIGEKGPSPRPSTPDWRKLTEDIKDALRAGGGRVPAVISAGLPKYDGETTYGVLITN